MPLEFDYCRLKSALMTDAKGNSWPVNVNDQGRNVSFTWSDRVLTVTPTAAPSNGNSFGQLLNTLMEP